MKSRIIVNGAFGKMGALTTATLKQHPDFEVIAELDAHDNLDTNLNKYEPQIVVDFTTAAVAFQNARSIINANIHPIIGTTGLKAAEVAELQELCDAKKLGGIIAPNFSIGALLMMQFAADAAKHFNQVEIIETHHQQKLDSPSGTALRTAELIAAQLKPDTTATLTPQQQTIPGARGATHHQIPIHSIRLPGRVAHQQVIFGGFGETLTIQHDSINRECFMPGVILACQRVMSLKTLVVGLEHLL